MLKLISTLGMEDTLSHTHFIYLKAIAKQERNILLFSFEGWLPNSFQQPSPYISVVFQASDKNSHETWKGKVLLKHFSVCHNKIFSQGAQLSDKKWVWRVSGGDDMCEEVFCRQRLSKWEETVSLRWTVWHVLHQVMICLSCIHRNIFQWRHKSVSRLSVRIILLIYHISISRPERECPELSDPTHGQVFYSGRHFQVDWADCLCRQLYNVYFSRMKQGTAVMRGSL